MVGLVGAAAAAVLVGISAANENLFLWAVNQALMFACIACSIKNYRLAADIADHECRNERLGKRRNGRGA